jgi:hypothetical protein
MAFLLNSLGAVRHAQTSIRYGADANSPQWELELVLDELDGELWIFRRDAGITRSLSRAIRRNQEGPAYLAPEIQLLYKARAIRAQDQADFYQVVPHLDPTEKAWLRESLITMDPEHSWISMLKTGPTTSA